MHVALAGMLAAGWLVAAAGSAVAAEDVFTPLVATPFNPSTSPALGTDGRWHFVYELQLANTRAAPATLRKLQVTGGSAAGNPVLVELGPEALAARLRGLDNRPASAGIELNASRLLLVDLALAAGDLPERLGHVLTLTGQATDVTRKEPVAQSYAGPVVDVLRRLPVLRPPLSGKGWVAFNGCCDPGPHRGTALPASEGLPYAIDRFAFSGRIPQANMADDLGGDYRRFRAASPEQRSGQFPLDMDVIDFGS